MVLVRSFASLALAFTPTIALSVTQTPLSPELIQVQAHLKGVQTMTADFAQTNSKGQTLTGVIQLKKPGKVRFQFQKNVPLLVIGDGRALTMIDYSVKQVSRWPIGNTPLSLLLDPNKDIARFAKIVPSADPDEILLAGAVPAHREYGSITVAFRKDPASPGGVILDGWTIMDAQNNRTTVRLSNQKFNSTIDDSTFRWTDPRPKGPRG